MKSKSDKKLPVNNDACDTDFVSDIKSILNQARTQAYTAVNNAMVQAYWLIGKRIVEEEQHGKSRAEYGKYIVKTVSEKLTAEFGKGYSVQSIKNFRQFYTIFPDLIKGSTPESQFIQKSSTLWSRLNWSHFKVIMRVSDPAARKWYIREAAENHWSVRTLDRNISTQYYQRLLASQIKEPVIREMKKKTEVFQNDKLEFIKNPSVLEFLNLPSNMSHTEQKLEKALIDNLQKFLLELGKGYAFIERQQLVRTETSDFYIDLVFYNYLLKCFVIIDLKTEKMTHQDIGQLDMYVRMFDELKRGKDDNPTIGILLCTETDKTIAKYSVLKENKQLFATKYLPYLPTEEELAAEVEREKELIRLQIEQGKEL